ncbi:MAG: YciI family protein [Bacteroidetes bacterium]|nr:YciI family protein [Bacteroidota bacterium]
MKEFLLIFRADYKAIPKDSPEEMQAMTKKWMDWIGSIAAQNKLFERGKRLTSDGKVLRANKTVTDGPYTEIKESIGGFSILKVESYEEAAEIAKGCPILTVGGNVEIREVSNL